MFFNKNDKAELTDQFAVYQERGAPRMGSPQFDLDAGISISGFEGEGQLGNVSVSGCSMKSVTYVAITPGEVYNVKINPGKEDKLPQFSLKLKLNWTKSSETVFMAGFSLEKGESNSHLKQYADALRARGISPDYGNMKR